MRRTLDILLLLSAVALLSSCAGRTGAGAVQKEARPFPAVAVPSVIDEPGERLEYVLNHYWDDFEGVPADELEKAMADFTGLMDQAPLAVSQKAMEVLFDRICEAEMSDTSAHHYVLMTQMVSKYLYDPNSSVRNEDYYLPFVRLMAVSPLTSEDIRPAYRYEAESCSICQAGTPAPDFTMRTASGRDMRLYDIHSRYTLLFFSNPGCEACRTIIDEICAVTDIDRMISDGEVSVVNVYIDEDLDAWKGYLHNYPESWISAYDPDGVIRGRRIYDVRAIPSLYLLDRDKVILMKDAPTGRVLARIINQ